MRCQMRHRRCLHQNTRQNKPGKSNELFQPFLPESTYNAIQLPDSSELPSSVRCSAHSYALHHTLHTPAPVYNSSQVITEPTRPLNEKPPRRGGERGGGGKININGCVPNWLVCLIKDTITRLCCNYPLFPESKVCTRVSKRIHTNMSTD